MLPSQPEAGGQMVANLVTPNFVMQRLKGHREQYNKHIHLERDIFLFHSQRFTSDFPSAGFDHKKVPHQWIQSCRPGLLGIQECRSKKW